MFKKFLAGLALVAFSGVHVVMADAVLFEYAFNINGEIYSSLDGDIFFNSLNSTEFDASTGLGTLSLTFTEAGTYNVASFFDFEISEPTNTFFNESGFINGNAPNGLVYEVDEPGYAFGDIYDNLMTGSFDNVIFGGQDIADDVSVGMAWNFTLTGNQDATINFTTLYNSNPDNVFFITQVDNTSGEFITYSSSLAIRDNPDPQPVPEPATLSLIVIGCAFFGLTAARKRK